MISAGQAAVSFDLVSGQADTAPASAPDCAGDVCKELPLHPGLEQPRELSVKHENKTRKEQMSYLEVWVWTKYA